MLAIPITLVCRQNLAIADQIGYIAAIAITAYSASFIILIIARAPS